MTSDRYERDFADWKSLRRPGRFDPLLLQNTSDAGDGNPGLQHLIRWGKIVGDNIIVSKPSDTESELQGIITELINNGGGTMILTPGTYQISSGLTLNTSVPLSIVGTGKNCVLKATGNNTVINVLSTGGCTLSNFKIDASTNTSSVSILYVEAGGIHIEDIEIVGEGHYSYGIDLNNSSTVYKSSIERCDISSVEVGIYIKTVDNLSITGNYIHNLSTPDSSLSKPNNVVGIRTNIGGGLVYISNNTIEYLYGGDYTSTTINGDGGDAYGIYIESSSCNIYNNFLAQIIGGEVYSFNSGIGGKGCGIRISSEGNLISNNGLTGIGGGISHTSGVYGGEAFGVYIEYTSGSADHNIIKNNDFSYIVGGDSPNPDFDGFTAAIANGDVRLSIVGGSYTIESGNIARNITTTGYCWIFTHYHVDHCVLEGNIVLNSTGGLGGTLGYHSEATSFTRFIVLGNNFYGLSMTTASPYDIIDHNIL